MSVAADGSRSANLYFLPRQKMQIESCLRNHKKHRISKEIRCFSDFLKQNKMQRTFFDANFDTNVGSELVLFFYKTIILRSAA